tara:strand:+ start:708 stop:932 length:225 start_codon:yes stop_codon:yes gene_type:complete
MINAPIVTKKVYENTEFTWWNPFSWYSNKDFIHNTLTPIHIRIRGRKIIIYADSIGHALVELSGKGSEVNYEKK